MTAGVVAAGVRFLPLAFERRSPENISGRESGRTRVARMEDRGDEERAGSRASRVDRSLGSAAPKRLLPRAGSAICKGALAHL